MADQSVQTNNINTGFTSTNTGIIRFSNSRNGNVATKNNNKKRNPFKGFSKQRFPNHYERTNQYHDNRVATNRFGCDDENIDDYRRHCRQELYWRSKITLLFS